MAERLTSIIIPVCNQLPYTKLCLWSIRRFTKNPCECILIDNNSNDGTQEFLSDISDIRVIKNSSNRGFAAACNQGMRAASGDFILLLNNDVYVTPGWLDNLLRCLYQTDYAGIVGPMTNYAAGRQKLSVRFETLSRMLDFARQFNRPDSSRWFQVNCLIGFCMLFRKRLTEDIGFLDETFRPGGMEDYDYCRRVMKAGFRLYCAGDTYVHHFGSRTFKGLGLDPAEVIRLNYSRYAAKWSGTSARQ